jgi:hypothetical protein
MRIHFNPSPKAEANRVAIVAQAVLVAANTAAFNSFKTSLAANVTASTDFTSLRTAILNAL